MTANEFEKTHGRLRDFIRGIRKPAYSIHRPDYVKCVLLGLAERNEVEENPEPHLTWCGRSASMEFAFKDPTHALLNALQGGRLLICNGCRATMEEALERGGER